MVSSTVESYGCVHLILKDGTWVIVRLRRLPAATGFSLFRHLPNSIGVLLKTLCFLSYLSDISAKAS